MRVGRWLLLYKREIILGFFLWIIMVGIALMQPRRYQSIASVIWRMDSSSSSLQMPLGLMSRGFGPTDYAVAILTSGSVRRNCLDTLKLTENPLFWGGRIPSSGSTMSNAMQVLTQQVDITARDTGVVEIRASTVDPVLSRNLAKYFLDYFLAKSKQNIVDKSDVVSEIIEQVTNDLAKVDRKIQSLRERYQIYGEEAQMASEMDSYQRLVESAIDAQRLCVGAISLSEGSGSISEQFSLKNTWTGVDSQRKYLENVISEREQRLKAMPAVLRTYTGLTRSQKYLEFKLKFYQERYEQILLEKQTQGLQPFQIIDSPIVPDEPLRRYLMLKAIAAAAISAVLATLLSRHTSGLSR